MGTQWMNGQYPEDKRIFDSQMEVYEWANSLYSNYQIVYLEKKMLVLQHLMKK